MGEARVQQSGSATRVRPGLAIVTGLPPVELGSGWRGEVYVQAGYVGGRDATGYFDGQVRVDRRIVGADDAIQVRAGAGAWTGGQEDAQRFDLGPTASARIPVDGATARVSVDWRFRVAGNAAPGSGPAVTVAAGF